jgi:hypothetical protein
MYLHICQSANLAIQVANWKNKMIFSPPEFSTYQQTFFTDVWDLHNQDFVWWLILSRFWLH